MISCRSPPHTTTKTFSSNNHPRDQEEGPVEKLVDEVGLDTAVV